MRGSGGRRRARRTSRPAMDDVGGEGFLFLSWPPLQDDLEEEKNYTPPRAGVKFARLGNGKVWPRVRRSVRVAPRREESHVIGRCFTFNVTHFEFFFGADLFRICQFLMGFFWRVFKFLDSVSGFAIYFWIYFSLVFVFCGVSFRVVRLVVLVLHAGATTI